jgi:hypothetical protein
VQSLVVLYWISTLTLEPFEDGLDRVMRKAEPMTGWAAASSY